MAPIQKTDLNPSNLEAPIQKTDLNPSDSELRDELTEDELTEDELLEVSGGSFWRSLNRGFNRALDLAVDITGIESSR
jgi:hypothetical protein